MVAEAVRDSERFTRSQEFEKGAFLKLAKPFIDSKAALAQVGAVLAAETEKLPEEITDRSLAVRCRGLATAGLLAVRAFRKGTVERLTISNLSMANSKAVLDIPPSIVKNRRPIQGPLPDVPWLHRIIALYIKSARPLLVNNQPDEGFWFTTFGGCGRRASHNVLYNGIRQILGVNPHAMRYVLATDGKRRHLSDDEIAEVLCHTPEMTRHIYQKIDAEDRNSRANHTITRIMGSAAA